MKQKTIEEKRAAVLAYCERETQSKFDWGNIWLRDGKPMFRLRIEGVASVGGYVEDFPDSTVVILYTLLGIETADAVKDLEARNAALVAALEEIAAEKSALDADDRQISIDTLSLHWSAVHRIASEARTKAEKEECAEIIRQAWDGIPVGFDVPAPDKKPKVRHNDDPQFPRYNPFEGEEE